MDCQRYVVPNETTPNFETWCNEEPFMLAPYSLSVAAAMAYTSHFSFCLMLERYVLTVQQSMEVRTRGIQVMMEFSSICAGLGDLERALARLQASTLAEVDGTNAAIYYEDTAKRKVLALITVLRGLQSVQVRRAATDASWNVSARVLQLDWELRSTLSCRHASFQIEVNGILRWHGEEPATPTALTEGWGP